MNAVLKKLLLPVLGLALPLTSLGVAFGYGSFFFGASQDVGVPTQGQADAIRDNMTFGDEGDPTDLGVKYYDVYFFAQNFTGVDFDSNGKPTKTYYGNSEDDTYGYWDYEGNNGPGIRATDDVALTSVYGATCTARYIKIPNVSYLPGEVMKALSNPVSGLVDSQGEDAPKSFLAWSCIPDPGTEPGVSGNNTGNYAISRDDLIIPNFNDVLQNVVKTTGMTPYEVNGAETLCFYPYYSGGKGYQEEDLDKRDGIRWGTRINGVDLWAYNPSLSSGFDAVYSYSGVEITGNEAENGGIYGIQASVYKSAATFSWDRTWTADWRSITFNFGNLELPKGRYNAYLFVKEAAENYGSRWNDIKDDVEDRLPVKRSSSPSSSLSFADESFKTNIVNVLHDESIEPYAIVPGLLFYRDGSDYSYDYYGRAYGLALERRYDYDLVGGSTGSFSVNDGIGFQSIGNSDSESGSSHKAVYEAWNVNFYTAGADGRARYDVSLSNGDTLSLPQNYFSIRLPSGEANFTLKVVNSGSSSRPSISFDGTTEYYHSQYGSDPSHGCMGMAKLEKESNYDHSGVVYNGAPIEDADDVAWQLIEGLQIFCVPSTGIYNIRLEIEYAVDLTNDSHRPTNVTLWCYQIHNIFVNIVEDDAYLEGSGNYHNVDYYSYRSTDYYYLLANLRSNDSYNSANGTKTLGELMGGYEAAGKCLQDALTGQYITLATYEDFVIERNYIFKVVDKPQKLIGEEGGN